MPHIVGSHDGSGTILRKISILRMMMLHSSTVTHYSGYAITHVMRYNFIRSYQSNTQINDFTLYVQNNVGVSFR